MLTKSNLDELARLVKAANLPWHIYKECQLDDQHEEIRDANHCYVKNLNSKRDRYILDACNIVPKLIAENQALQERVQEMDWQMVWLAKQVCDSFSPQEWINRAEQAFKEARE